MSAGPKTESNNRVAANKNFMVSCLFVCLLLCVCVCTQGIKKNTKIELKNNQTSNYLCYKIFDNTKNNLNFSDL